MKSCVLVFGVALVWGAARGDPSSTSHVSISLGKSSVAYNNDHLLNHEGSPGHKHGLEQAHSFVHVPESNYDPGSGPVEVHEPSFFKSDREFSFGKNRHFSVTPFIHSTPSPSYFEFHDHVSQHPYSISSPAPFHDSNADRFHYPSFSFPHFFGPTPRPDLRVPMTEKKPGNVEAPPESDSEETVSSKRTKAGTSKQTEKEEPKSSEGSEQESVETESRKEEESKEDEPESSKEKSSSTSTVNAKVFHPSEKTHSFHHAPDSPETLRIPTRNASPYHKSRFLSVHPHAFKHHRAPHQLKHNPEESPGCAEKHKDFCQKDDNYPGYEILNAAYQHATELLSLYADVAGVNTELSVELSEKVEGRESYLCPANITYAQIFRAKNVGGKWRFIVNNIELHYQTLTQTVRLEECLLDGENCPLVPHCFESKCLQKSVYHRFLVYDPYDLYMPFLIESFKLPTACACHLGKYELEEH